MRLPDNLPTKLALLCVCLTFITMADSCYECNPCNSNRRNAQLVVTFDDSTSITKAADGNGCISYDRALVGLRPM